MGFLTGPSPVTKYVTSINAKNFMDCKVAIKIPSNLGYDEMTQIFREIDVMKTIGYNEHVARMLGICFLDKKPVMVVELADSDLLKYVKNFKAKLLEHGYFPYKIFFSILWQISKGMQYVASKNIIHRDLAARNTLLTENFSAKISDFGLSMNGDSKTMDEYLPKKLPIKWLSLEAIVQKLFSEKSDVWAFGVLMYEVFSFGKVPYKDTNSVEELVELLREGKRLDQPEYANDEIFELMKSCWMEDPEDRPTFEELSGLLYGILTTVTEGYSYLETKEE